MASGFTVGDQVQSVEFGRGEIVWVYRFGLLVEFMGGACHHLLDEDLVPFTRAAA